MTILNLLSVALVPSDWTTGPLHSLRDMVGLLICSEIRSFLGCSYYRDVWGLALCFDSWAKGSKSKYKGLRAQNDYRTCSFGPLNFVLLVFSTPTGRIESPPLLLYFFSTHSLTVSQGWLSSAAVSAWMMARSTGIATQQTHNIQHHFKLAWEKQCARSEFYPVSALLASWWSQILFCYLCVIHILLHLQFESLRRPR